MRSSGGRRFPLFVSLEGRRVLVAGGGRIAGRRVKTLLEFGPGIMVVAPVCSEEILNWEDQGRIEVQHREYEKKDIEEAFLVLAATDSSEVNERIYRDCREAGILVNVCSDRELCDFHFPGVICQEELTVGINASGQNHRKARRAREAIEKCLQGDSADE